MEVLTTYFAVTNYAELAVSCQQFFVPYFSHGDTSVIFATFCGVNLSLVQRSAARRWAFLTRGHQRHPVSLRNCFALRKACGIAYRPEIWCVAPNNCEPLRCTCQSKHYATRVYFSCNATFNELEANISCIGMHCWNLSACSGRNMHRYF